MLWVRVALWGLLTTVAVTTSGVAWARTTSGSLQAGTVVASASAEQLDRADRSLGGSSDVSPGEVSRGLGSTAREGSKPVLLPLRVVTPLADRVSEAVVVSVGRLNDAPGGVFVGVGAAESVSGVARAFESERSGVGVGDVGESTVDATPGAGSDVAVQRSVGGETTYTYWDGDAEITVWLVPQTVTPDVEPEDPKAAPKSGSGAEQNRRSVSGTGLGVPSGQLVFRTATGSQMWLPGGVVLVLDAAWSTAQTDAFFVRNGIEADRVTEFDWLDNGFLIESGPGLASLELANRLVGQQGVVLSSPDWSVEAELK